MKKQFFLAALAFVLTAAAAAQVNIPITSQPGGSSPKRVKPTAKTVTGQVTNKADQPIAGAVVYLKNTKTLEVKSFFTQENGNYRFPQVALNTDYEIWAEKEGKKSSIKAVSQFDDRYTPTINLHLDISN